MAFNLAQRIQASRRAVVEVRTEPQASQALASPASESTIQSEKSPAQLALLGFIEKHGLSRIPEILSHPAMGAIARMFNHGENNAAENAVKLAELHNTLKTNPVATHTFLQNLYLRIGDLIDADERAGYGLIERTDSAQGGTNGAFRDDAFWQNDASRYAQNGLAEKISERAMFDCGQQAEVSGSVGSGNATLSESELQKMGEE